VPGEANMMFLVEVVRKVSDEVAHAGEFETKDEAIACAKRTVDAFLLREYRDGMASGQLFDSYKDRGEHPCVFKDGDATVNVPGFNHLQYALNRSVELCGKIES
jgi:hypothetical protein